MAEDNLPSYLSASAEEDESTSWYTAGAAGIASGVLKIPEGVVSLAAELIDLGADTNTAASVEEFFDKLNPFEEVAEERAIGKITETLVSLGVPATAGFRLGSKMGARALKAARENRYGKIGQKKVYKNLQATDRLNKSAGRIKFATGVLGGAVGETFVADVEKIGTFGDIFDLPTALDQEETGGSDEALRKLTNRLKFSTEGLFITPVIAGVGKTAKALATRSSADLAYGSKFDRFINKYFKAPFTPKGNLTTELKASQDVLDSLKVADQLKAKEIVENFTVIANKMYPQVDNILGKSVGKTEQTQFLNKLTDLMFEGDLAKGLDIGALRSFSSKLGVKNLSKNYQKALLNNVNEGRQKFTELFQILDRVNPAQAKQAKNDFKKLLKKRVEGWLGSTYKIYEDKGLFGFKAYKPTDEAYDRAVNIFRRMYRNQAEKGLPQNKRTKLVNSETGKPIPMRKDGTFPMKRMEKGMLVPEGDAYLMKAKAQVDGILKSVAQQKKPGSLPDFKYAAKTMEGMDTTNTKSFENAIKGVDRKVAGKGSKAFRELFGEIQDARYKLYNGVTNLSAIARTAAYFDDVVAKNNQVQAAGGRGFFWGSEAAAKAGVESGRTGIEVVSLRELVEDLPGGKLLNNDLAEKFTTREIAEAMASANGIASGLQGFVRGETVEGSAKAVSALYRNLLLFPKGISQMAKTIFSIPTHLRNMFSAVGFSGANGILFENPRVVAQAFKEGVNVSGLLKLGPKSPEFQKAYRELVEYGVVNSQVQIGDLAATFKDLKGGLAVHNVDSFLSPFMRKMKNLKEFAQGKYVAEDDTFKITNYMVERYRYNNAYKKAGIKPPRDLLNTIPEAELGRRFQVAKTGTNAFKGTYEEFLDEQALRLQAADIVKNTVPNYSYVGPAVKTARLLPIGNFMSFPSEMIRTTTNIAQLGLKEMRHSRATIGSNVTPLVFDKALGRLVKNDNPLYGIGVKRLAGMATFTTGVPIALTEGAKALYDVTDEELAALRRFVPEWSKNSTILPSRDEDGNLRYTDFSHSNAYDVVARPFRTLFNEVMEGEKNDRLLLQSFVSGAGQAGAEIMNPFISESIWTEAVADIIIRGGRTEDGRQLYTDQTSAGDQAAITFLHLGAALAPAYKQFVRLGQASFGVPDKRGDVLDIGPELGGLMGFRAIKVDPERSMGFKIGDYQRGIRNSRREFTGGFFGLLKGGSIDPDDVVDQYIKSNRARFNVQKNMYRDIEAAEILGASTGNLGQIFKDRQVGLKKFNSLRQGIFDPYFPSRDILFKFNEIARNLGEPDAFVTASPDVLDIRRQLQSAGLDGRFDFAVGGHVIGLQLEKALQDTYPVLQQIDRDLKKLTLDDEFDIDVTDYIVREEIVTPPLPPQPQPNQQVVMPPNPLQPINDGLTPTERALLSPEEQTMRLKQRGFIT